MPFIWGGKGINFARPWNVRMIDLGTRIRRFTDLLGMGGDIQLYHIILPHFSQWKKINACRRVQPVHPQYRRVGAWWKSFGCEFLVATQRQIRKRNEAKEQSTYFELAESWSPVRRGRLHFACVGPVKMRIAWGEKQQVSECVMVLPLPRWAENNTKTLTFARKHIDHLQLRACTRDWCKAMDGDDGPFRWDTYLGFGEGYQHVEPPFRLLRAGTLHERDTVRCGDGDRVRVAGDVVGRGHLQDLRHVDYGLWNCFGLQGEREWNCMDININFVWKYSKGR